MSDRNRPDGPHDLGRRYEASLSAEARSAGAHYTPPDVARRLVDLVVSTGDRPKVWDPACGGGAFLLAVADSLADQGVDPGLILAELLWGTDIDPGAVAVAHKALRWWGQLHGTDASPGTHLAVADPLLASTQPDQTWPDQFGTARGFDLVLGNPPFQGQLAGTNVRTLDELAALRARWGTEVVRPYTDTAALFLVAGAQALAPGGRLLMIQPTSTLAARDAAGARAAACRVADLTGLWVAAEPVFDADVEVCAVVLRRRIDVDSAPKGQVKGVEGADCGRAVARWRGRNVDRLPDTAVPSKSGHQSLFSNNYRTNLAPDDPAPTWAPLAMAALGVPDPLIRSDGRLGSIVTVRAGFRDEYYGLVGHVAEAPDDEGTDSADTAIRGLDGLRPLVTTGLIDPGRSLWGDRPARFAHHQYQRPAVNIETLAADPSQPAARALAWVRSTSMPKVVVATQTTVGEAAVDEVGTWVASTPALVVLADNDDLWAVAAIICSPVGSVAALAASAGAGRSGQGIRHNVTTVAGLPFPVDSEALARGAAALRTRDRDAFLAAMADAYDVVHSDEMNAWWSSRSPW